LSIIQNEGQQAAQESQFDKLVGIKRNENFGSVKSSFIIGPPSDQMNLKSSIKEQTRSNKISQKTSGANNSPTKSKRSDRSNNRYENES
jgi:hypothetical protein